MTDIQSVKPKSSKRIKTWVTVLLVLVTLVVGVLCYSYFRMPNQALLTIPAESFPVTEVISHPGIENFRIVTALEMYVESRSEFIEVTAELENGEPYSYLTAADEKAMSEVKAEDERLMVEATTDSIDTVYQYGISHYKEQEALDWMTPYSYNEKFVGDSATLLQILILEGIHKKKEWLTTDLTIGVTGALDVDGTVREVGAVELKSYSLAQEGIDIFILPATQLEQAKRFLTEEDTLQLVGVSTLEEAMNWLDQNAK